MPQFYTSVLDDNGIEHDEQGQEFASAEDAVASGRRSALGLLAEQLAEDPCAVSFKVFVEDEGRNRLATISVMGSVVR